MHIFENVSRLLRTPPSPTPRVSSEFYPVKSKLYITIYNDQSVSSNYYDYFNDVVFDLRAVFKEQGIEIIQFLNSPTDKRINGCHYIERFTPPQMSFVISNSLLHIGTDGYSTELSGALWRPTLVLTGNRFPELSLPWYSEKHECLFGLTGEKPSFAATEKEKAINRIKSEEICQTVFRMLGLENTPPFKTLFIGPRYHEDTLCDIVPTSRVLDPSLAKWRPVVRLDKGGSEENCLDFCQSVVFGLVVRKKPSNFFLDTVRKNCGGVIFLASKHTKPDEIIEINQRGVAVKIATTDLKNFKKIAFNVLDAGIVEKQHPLNSRSERSKLAGKPFRSSKIIFKDGKLYPSYSHLEKKSEIAIINSVIDSPDFWEDESHYKIMEKTDE